METVNTLTIDTPVQKEVITILVDKKVMVWGRETHRIEVGEGENIKDTAGYKAIIESLKKEPLNGSSELSSFTGTYQILSETEDFLVYEDNGNQPTIEIINNDSNETLWTNDPKS